MCLIAQNTEDYQKQISIQDPLPSSDNKDPFLRGEFDVIKQLLEKFPETQAGKTLADKMIDINGPPPEGFGLQNLRKSIIQMKYKYDASTEDKQTGEL